MHNGSDGPVTAYAWTTRFDSDRNLNNGGPLYPPVKAIDYMSLLLWTGHASCILSPPTAYIEYPLLFRTQQYLSIELNRLWHPPVREILPAPHASGLWTTSIVKGSSMAHLEVLE